MRPGLVFLLALSFTCLAAEPPAPWPVLNSFEELLPVFARPPAGYSTAPFFVWNGEVTEREIDAFLSDFKAHGITGFFIHPRPGLITTYLSDRWFALIRYTVDRAKSLGMQAWLYDENSYPSGFAGGHVPVEMPESWNQGQGLVLKKLSASQSSDLSGCKVLLRRSGEIYCFELAFYDRRAWFGGFSYVDLIKPGVTEKFIELTMRDYEKSIGAEFGRSIPGIFTDEPNIVAPVRKNGIRWTPDLFDQFQKRYGYDLKTNLPSLIEETGRWRKVRHDYYSLLLDLFIERFAKPWHDYTQAKRLLWTGHYWEHEWPSPAQGPDTMAMDAWFDVPGIDMLFNQFNEGVSAQFGNVRAVKELASVANQMGRRRTLSETYGGAGWELRYEDMKRLGDWEYSLGVNLMNTCMSLMTTMGSRKADYPQSFSYHNPWWKHYKVLANYYARLSAALSTGEQVNRIVVLEPTTSAWLYASGGGPDPRLKAIGDAFQAFVTRLEHLQVEYDLASERIMRDRGRVSGSRLVVGQRGYEVFVIPPGTENLESSTVRLLEDFTRQGGKLLAFASPAYVDGEPSTRQWEIIRSLDDPETRSLLLPSDIASVDGSIFHHRRKLKDGELLFFANHSLERPASAELRLSAPSIARLDPFTGRLEQYPARRVELPPAGSLLLYAGSAKVTAPVVAASGKSEQIPPQGALEVRRLEPNVLTIDYCDLKIGGTTEAGLYYYRAGERVFQHYGLPANPWNAAIQYKTSILDKNTFPPESGFELTYRFTVEGLRNRTSLRAVVERPSLWKVALNGKPLVARPGEWAFDRAFGVYDLGAAVTDGENRLTLSAQPMSVHHEIEPVYITGDFGVAAQSTGFKVIPAAPLALDSWKTQELPFYPGEVAYAHDFKVDTKARYVVRLGRWSGTVAEVRVNGASAGIIGWQPYECDITGLIKPGVNRVEVVVTGSLKNRQGPHHGTPNPGLVSPGSFRSAPRSIPSGNSYQLLDYGLMEDYQLISIR